MEYITKNSYRKAGELYGTAVYFDKSDSNSFLRYMLAKIPESQRNGFTQGYLLGVSGALSARLWFLKAETSYHFLNYDKHMRKKIGVHRYKHAWHGKGLDSKQQGR